MGPTIGQRKRSPSAGGGQGMAVERAAAKGCHRQARGRMRGSVRDGSARAEEVTSGKNPEHGRGLEPGNEAHVEDPVERAHLRHAHGGVRKESREGSAAHPVCRDARARAHDSRLRILRGCRTHIVVLPTPVGLGDSCAKQFDRERNEALRGPFSLPPFAQARRRASTGGGSTPDRRPRAGRDLLPTAPPPR